MKYEIIETKSYRKDVKKMIKQGKKMEFLIDIVDRISNGETLEPKYRDHALQGKFSGCRECHIAPDWLLVYRIDKGELELILLHTKSHSDLF